MSCSDSQTPIREPVPLRPVGSANFRDSLQIPNQPRPISQESTYTDSTSRRGSLEINPPHLAPGERPQIMTARPLNLGPQVPTPPPSPPLLERKSGFKKWLAFVVVGAASLMVILMIVAVVLLVTFGTRKHTSKIYVQATVAVSNGTEAAPVLAVPGPGLGRRGGWKSTNTASPKMANIAHPNQHPAVPITTFTVSDGVAVLSISEIATKEQDSTATVLEGVVTVTTKNVISTVMSPASIITTTIIAVPEPTPNSNQPALPTSIAPPPASVTVKLQFTIKESSGLSTIRGLLIWGLLSAVVPVGVIWAWLGGF